MHVHVILNSNISEGTVTFIKPAIINSSYLQNIYPDHVNLKTFVLILVFLTFFKVYYIFLVVYVWILCRPEVTPVPLELVLQVFGAAQFGCWD